MNGDLEGELGECPKEAEKHFRNGNDFYIKGEYLDALKEYFLAFRAGFPDRKELIEIMRDVGINMGLLKERDLTGYTERKKFKDLTPEELQVLNYLPV